MKMYIKMQSRTATSKTFRCTVVTDAADGVAEATIATAEADDAGSAVSMAFSIVKAQYDALLAEASKNGLTSKATTK
jgi:hypothetical protein